MGVDWELLTCAVIPSLILCQGFICSLAFETKIAAPNMSTSFDYTKVNLYDVLEISSDASEKDVRIE